MIIAFSLLSIGYLGLGVLPTLLEAAGLVSYGATTQFNGLPDSYTRWIIVPVLFVLMVGGSFIKSIISASVAKETTEATRAWEKVTRPFTESRLSPRCEKLKEML